MTDGVAIGHIGEIRPEVLERTQITMPCAAFEINLDTILRLAK
jgi:phenylalanyl-tRNA synthetase beta subunit